MNFMPFGNKIVDLDTGDWTIAGNANAAGDAARQRRRINDRAFGKLRSINEANAEYWRERQGR